MSPVSDLAAALMGCLQYLKFSLHNVSEYKLITTPSETIIAIKAIKPFYKNLSKGHNYNRQLHINTNFFALVTLQSLSNRRGVQSHIFQIKDFKINMLISVIMKSLHYPRVC